MTGVQGTYLGWQELGHSPECRRPVWTAEISTATAYRNSYTGAERHRCADVECDHGPSYERTSLRLVCRSCGVVHQVRGEMDGTSVSSSAQAGIGLPPRRVAGLSLWPGAPWLAFGRSDSAEPFDFLVTRPGAERVTEKTVVGEITQSLGHRGGVQWSAAAVASEAGPYGLRTTVRWAYAEEGLRTIAAAAKWIGARLAEADAEAGKDTRGSAGGVHPAAASGGDR